MDIEYFRAGALSLALFGLAVLAAPVKGEVLEANGFQMYYETAGQGQPLLLLHAITQVGADWDPIKNDLTTEFRLIIPDLRGHGSSTNPSGEFTHKQAALDMYALLDHLNINQAQAIGFSTGGMTLLHMATQQPERISAMVIIGAAGYFPEQARTQHRNIDPNNVPDEQMQELRAVHKHGDEQIRSLMRQFSAFQNNYDDMNFTPPYLSTITARTLIMQGDRDRFFPVSIGVGLYEAIPQSYLWIVPNMDHFAMFGPTREHFVCTATAFLRDQWQSRPARLCE